VAEWVCPECGLDYGTLSLAALPGAARDAAAGWATDLAAADPDRATRRPAPEVWSPLEYAGHTRGVVESLADTVDAMAANAPIPSMGEEGDDDDLRRYDGVAPALTVDDFREGVDGLVVTLSRLDATGAAKTSQFPWGERDALTMARNSIHELVHHLMDVKRGLAAP
jgi:S-DNA-T family DNA segregation ATPase FtsK/SpoIIIE